MHDRMTTVWTLVIATMLAVGCAKSPASAPATAPPPGDDPAGTEVTCHLECSGTHATGSGATEAEARADVSQHVEQNCKPEDGQYFIFCDPPK
jgi:hypothetical protein